MARIMSVMFAGLLLSAMSAGAGAPQPGEDCNTTIYLTGDLPMMVSGDSSTYVDDVDLSAWPPCDDGGVQSGGTGEGPDVVYEIVPSATCELRLTLTPTDGADLAIYATRICDLFSSSCVGVDDGGGAGETESFTFTATKDVRYLVFVDGSGGSSGSYTLSIEETTSTGCYLRHRRDICWSFDIPNPTLNYSGDTTAAGVGDDYDPIACGSLQPASGDGADLVYGILPLISDCRVQVTLTPTDGADLAVYVITDCDNVDGTCVAGVDDGGAGAAEVLTFDAAAITIYELVVDGSGGDGGAFDLEVICSDTVACCLSDGCAELTPTTCASKGGVDLGVVSCSAVAPGVCVCHPADIADGDGVVNLFDLLLLIDNWGTDGPGAAIADPLDVVDLFDLLALLDAWGEC